MRPVDETKRYLGKPCKHGHYYLNTHKSIRYKGDNSCCVCSAEQQKKHRENNPEKIKAYKKKFKEANKDRIKIQNKESYNKHRNKRVISCRLWRINNPEKSKASWINYTQKHPEKIKEKNKKYRALFPERSLSYKKKYSKNLTDSYVRGQIRKAINIEQKDITQEMILVKRQQLFLTREIKTIKMEVNNGTN